MVSNMIADVLPSLLYPKSVAVIGVTDTPDRVGYNVLESIVGGGFTGAVYPIHPRHQELQGRKVYKSLAEVPAAVDLAVISLNEHLTVEAAEQCGRAGVKGLVCHAGGFRETGETGQQLEKELIAITQKYKMLLIGPNTLGFVNTDNHLNVTFFPMNIPPSKISIVCQSGGVGLNSIQLTIEEGVGLNKFIGVGNCSVLDVPDYLDYLENDPSTDVIGVYVEGVAQARKFVQTAARVARKKPVVVYKAGRIEGATQYTQTHTGAIAGSYRLYEEILHQHGIFTVDSTAEFVVALKALALQPLPQGNRIGVLTHTAGPIVATLDGMLSRACTLPTLSDATIKRIKQVMGTDSPPVVVKNPVDAVGLGFTRENFSGLAEVMLQDDNIDLLVTFFVYHKYWNFPTEEIVEIAKKQNKPVMINLVGCWEDCRADQLLAQKGGVPLYTLPEKTALATAALVFYGKQRKGGANFED